MPVSPGLATNLPVSDAVSRTASAVATHTAGLVMSRRRTYDACPSTKRPERVTEKRFDGRDIAGHNEEDQETRRDRFVQLAGRGYTIKGQGAEGPLVPPVTSGD